MTGLDPEKDCLVEVAAIITNSDLQPVSDGIDIVIKPRPESLANMSDFVRDMHTTSGLINEFENGVSLAEAEAELLQFVKNYIPEPRQAPLAGNSIGTDRMFLNRYMPALDQHLHYRNIDVSSLKELARRWYPRVYFQLPKKDGEHRALADIRESIQELRYYRQTIMVADPGPTTDEAKMAAEKVSGSL